MSVKSDRLALFSDRLLPLHIDRPLGLHRLATSVDLFALQVRWDHQTYGSLNFDSPRLRPDHVHLRPPVGSDLPALIAITHPELVDYREDRSYESGTYGHVSVTQRYLRYAVTLFEPEIGERRTAFGRMRPDGAGFLSAHAMEWQQSTIYERNGDPEWASIGALTIGINAALPSLPWPHSLYPHLELPQFAYLLEELPTFPTKEVVQDAVTDPAPLPTGSYTIEVGAPAVDYNIGHRLGRVWENHDGVASLSLTILAGVDEPLNAISGGPLTEYRHRPFVDAIGEGHVSAIDSTEAILIDYGGS